MNKLLDFLEAAQIHRAEKPNALLLFAVDTHIVALQEEAIKCSETLDIALNTIPFIANTDIEIITFDRTELENKLPALLNKYGDIFVNTEFDKPENVSIFDPKTMEEIARIYEELEATTPSEPVAEPIEPTAEPTEPVEPVVIEPAEPAAEPEPVQTTEPTAEPVIETEPLQTPWHIQMANELLALATEQITDYNMAIVATKYEPLSEINGRLSIIAKDDSLEKFHYGDIMTQSKYLYINDRMFDDAAKVAELIGSEGWKYLAAATISEPVPTSNDLTVEEMTELFISEYNMDKFDAKIFAEYFDRFVKALRTNIVEFSYVKKDGTLRKACGTLLTEYMPTPKGNGKPLDKKLQLYYDLDRKALRSFERFKMIDFKSR